MPAMGRIRQAEVADFGGCYPSQPSASLMNTLLDPICLFLLPVGPSDMVTFKGQNL